MTKAPNPPARNRILAALPSEDYERLAAQLAPVEMAHGELFYEAGQRIKYVYFPNNLMTSLVSQMADGENVEVGVIGFEGMVGISVALGMERAPHETMAQIPGHALRLEAGVLMDEFNRGGMLQRLLLRYTHTLMIQMGQSAACNRLHTIEERLARWLLMCHDRVEGDDLALTQEFISMMLGVRRAGITNAAVALQAEGFIKYRRGHITVIDRPALEEFACECYAVIKADFDGLLN
ncbi:MAG: Crp/Fnr family transcriptional regulator [Pyrinomonadaceae bacterium]